MKIVRLPPEHRSSLADCISLGSNLYVTGCSGMKIYKYTENGKFMKVPVENSSSTLLHAKDNFTSSQSAGTVETWSPTTTIKKHITSMHQEGHVESQLAQMTTSMCQP